MERRPPLDRSSQLPDAYRGAARPIDPQYQHLLDAERRILDGELAEVHRARRTRLLNLGILAFVLAWLLLFVLFALSADAQTARRATAVEQLARIVVHETGWDDTGDAEAIYAVLVEGGEREGVTWQRYARRYSRRLHRGEVSRRWAAELTEACTRPPSWPSVVTVRRRDGSLEVRSHLRWGAYRGRCVAVMVRVREVLAGERVHGCERAPHDWGGRVDRARARRLGLIEINCSRGDVETVGDYYERPSLAAGVE